MGAWVSTNWEMKLNIKFLTGFLKNNKCSNFINCDYVVYFSSNPVASWSHRFSLAFRL